MNVLKNCENVKPEWRGITLSRGSGGTVLMPSSHLMPHLLLGKRRTRLDRGDSVWGGGRQRRLPSLHACRLPTSK